MKYEALIHCEHSRRDSYGNVYWLAKFTNPDTGQSVSAEVDSPSNARSLAAYALHPETDKRLAFAECYCTESEIPVREWQRRRKPLFAAKLYEGSPALTDALRNLFRTPDEQACMSCRDGLDCPRDPACHA